MAAQKKQLAPLPKQIQNDQQKLVAWYLQNQRKLPWRKNKDAYRIWISEVMLQQTTVTAVIPFYEKFMKAFPTVKALAEAPLEKVYENWAGLGYYSRARNLHKASKLFAKNGFPQTAAELIEYPGLGPYTSRAVASLAFGEKVGVLDGNVIRVLSRKYGLELNWWESSAKKLLQNISDELAQCDNSSALNQGLMELGATVCTPKKVLCLLCPWNKDCLALKNNLVEKLPLKKEKPEFQIWEWNFTVYQNNHHEIFLAENKATPFLKLNHLPPSEAQQVNKKPKNFHFKHGVTKFDIYVTVQKKKGLPPKSVPGLWANLDSIAQINPTSLMKKIITHL